MFNVDLDRINNIQKDIRKSKKRKAFVLDDKWFFKVVTFFMLYMIASVIALLCFKHIALGFFFPVLVFGFPFAFVIWELKNLIRDNKTENNLNKVVEALEKTNVKTNTKNLSDSIIMEDVILSNTKTEKIVSNNCYLFLDNQYRLQGLLENDEKFKRDYYLLEQHELSEIIDSDEFKKKMPKVKKLVRERKK